MIVVDASPLIALAKMRRLALLKKIYGAVIVAPEVKAEVVEGGKAVGAPEVRLVEAAIRDGWIQEAELTGKEKKMAQDLLGNTRLAKGEVESIVLARCRKLMVILDDKEARAVASAMRAEHIGTAGVLLDAYLSGALDYGELEEAVRELGGVIWLSPDVVAEILRQARGMRK
ncbi:MAG: hypothetical protein HY645_14870 [Acidobacteria bacterium]|nr:hypothetical protein [Acidobacteriota bacterium]